MVWCDFIDVRYRKDVFRRAMRVDVEVFFFVSFVLGFGSESVVCKV